MKIKTSITLDETVLNALDEKAGGESRSAYIERVIEEHLRREARNAIHTRDLEILNREAEALNAEAEEVLDFQSWPEE